MTVTMVMTCSCCPLLCASIELCVWRLVVGSFRCADVCGGVQQEARRRAAGP